MDEFVSLRQSVGWTVPSHVIAEEALERGLFAVCARDEAGLAIGMARVVGDGFYFYVQDVVVVPEHQGRGVAHAMMSLIAEWLDEKTGDENFVGLVTERHLESFYKGFGFDVPGSTLMRRSFRGPTS